MDGSRQESSRQDRSHSMACSQEDMDNVQSIVQQVTIEARLSSQEASQPTLSEPVKDIQEHQEVEVT